MNKQDEAFERLIKNKFAELRIRAQSGEFWAFCLFMNYSFFIKRKFLKVIADAFQRLFNIYKAGGIYKIAVSMAPRAGKSYITTLFCTFVLGHFSKGSVMRNCVSNTLYEKFSFDARTLIQSDKFQFVFPHIKLNQKRTQLRGWYLEGSENPAYFGAGVGGTIIGFGANLLSITDDLFKSFEDAMSERINEKTWIWKTGSHDSRTEKNCCCLDIGTRWSKDDVIGRLEECGYYDEIIRIPALDENDVTFCEDVNSSEFYIEKRNTLDEYIFASEYQQNPVELAGLLFPRSELQYFKPSELKGKKALVSLSVCDVADEGDDYLSAPFADFFGEEKFFIKDVLFTQDNVEITQPLLVGKLLENKTHRILFESNNGGHIFQFAISEQLKKNRLLDIKSRPTVSNKKTRILLQSGFIKRHFVFIDPEFVKPGSNYARFMDQLCSYLKTGTSKHDDAPDSLTILVEFIISLGLLEVNSANENNISKGTLGLY